MSWREHWRKGRADGFPPCCIARWVVTRQLRGPNAPQGRERGTRYTYDGTPYVPCRVIHR